MTRHTAPGWPTRLAARADRYAEVIAALPVDAVVGFFVWGDPAFYDSTIRVVDAIGKRPPIVTHVVPGISAFQALAAAHSIVLHAVGQPVHITTGRRLVDEWRPSLGSVVVMLDGHLACQGLVERAPDLLIHWGAYLGLPADAALRSPGRRHRRRDRRPRRAVSRARMDHGRLRPETLVATNAPVRAQPCWPTDANRGPITHRAGGQSSHPEALQDHRRGETRSDTLTCAQPEGEQRLEAQRTQDRRVGPLGRALPRHQMGLNRGLDPGGEQPGEGTGQSVEDDRRTRLDRAQHHAGEHGDPGTTETGQGLTSLVRRRLGSGQSGTTTQQRRCDDVTLALQDGRVRPGTEAHRLCRVEPGQRAGQRRRNGRVADADLAEHHHTGLRSPALDISTRGEEGIHVGHCQGISRLEVTARVRGPGTDRCSHHGFAVTVDPRIHHKQAQTGRLQRPQRSMDVLATVASVTPRVTDTAYGLTPSSATGMIRGHQDQGAAVDVPLPQGRHAVEHTVEDTRASWAEPGARRHHRSR